ncbi:MAG: formylglycine-generating enzyme family protein [Granulosicoccus sp.]|nr:formylglycine-generating enzyme family protein [Granulosicoccus sp.]
MLNNRVSLALLVCSLCFTLQSCESEVPAALSMEIAIPRSTAAETRSFSDYEGAGVEVTINDQSPVTFTRQTTDNWVIDVSGLVLDAENSVFLRWFVEINNETYDIATQAETFNADSSLGTHTISTNYISEPFDHDNDSVSNLVELNAGGFPASAELEPEMVPINTAFCFDMGSPPEEHEPLGYFNEMQVEICNLTDYAIGRYEITFEQYQQFAVATDRDVPSQYDWSGDNLPVTDVRWSDARDYTQWLATITGLNYRLPTEAQWEFAARGNTTTAYHTGQSIDTSRANYRESEQAADELRAIHVQTVDAENSGIVDGVFRLENNGQWVEYGIDRQTWIELPAFTFEEIQRDVDGILINDAARNITLRLSTGRSQVFLIDNTTGEEGILYNIVDGPNALSNLVGIQPVTVGSFPANAYGLQDVHGNVFEWTCSLLEPTYNGAEQECVDIAPTGGDNQRMIKRGGSWLFGAAEIRSANRGWNNEAGSADNITGFRVVLNP